MDIDFHIGKVRTVGEMGIGDVAQQCERESSNWTAVHTLKRIKMLQGGGGARL